MTAEEFAAELRALVGALSVADLLIDEQPPVFVRLGGRDVRVRWNSGGTSDTPIRSELPDSVATYLTMVRERQFSCLTRSGAAFQLSADFSGTKLVAYRYLYNPCPVRIDLGSLDEMLGEFAFSDIIESEIEHRPAIPGSQTLQVSPLRFEYDPSSVGENHAAAHLHINLPNAHIPMLRTLSVRRFMLFVSEHFEPELRAALPAVRASDRALETSTLPLPEQSQPHLAWATT